MADYKKDQDRLFQELNDREKEDRRKLNIANLATVMSQGGVSFEQIAKFITDLTNIANVTNRTDTERQADLDRLIERSAAAWNVKA